MPLLVEETARAAEARGHGQDEEGGEGANHDADHHGQAEGERIGMFSIPLCCTE